VAIITMALVNRLTDFFKKDKIKRFCLKIYPCLYLCWTYQKDLTKLITQLFLLCQEHIKIG